MRWAVLPVTVALAVAGCASDKTYSGGDYSYDQTAEIVDRYCRYGAVSAAQLDGCREHITVREISQLRTNAARYGLGELDRCRWDSGPFCPGRVAGRAWGENQTGGWGG